MDRLATQYGGVKLRHGHVGWTDDEDAELRTLWATDMPAWEIGRRMGRTANSVIGHAHRLGLAKKPPAPPSNQQGFLWTSQRDRILRRNWGRMRLLDIGQELGCSEFIVAKRARRLGLPPQEPGVRKGTLQPSTIVRGLRPPHTLGEAGEREWFESCDAVFVEAMHAAYQGQEGGAA